MYKLFQSHTWQDFERLGFHTTLINLLSLAINRLKNTFSTKRVWTVLSCETVKKIVLTVLDRETYYYVKKVKEYSWKTHKDLTSNDRADISRETTLCPSPLMNSMVVGGYKLSGVGGRSRDEKSNDERSLAETWRHDDGNDGDNDLFRNRWDKYDDNVDQTDSDESEESEIMSENYINQFQQQVHQTTKARDSVSFS